VDKEGERSKAGRLNECYREERKTDTRFNTIDESKRMCPHLYVQHVATYRNGESEAGYWGEVDPKSHKVSFSLLISFVKVADDQVSLDPYRRESLKILAIFKEMVPKGEIGQSSSPERCDERLMG